MAPPPARPAAGAAPVPSTPAPGPEGLPLSYSGTMGGVEVLVRGGPISVAEDQATRTIIINADGLWIRVRIPPEIRTPEEGRDRVP